MALILERYEIAGNDNIQSLVKAEWDTIRSPQQTLCPSWPLVNKRFTKDCCGILFSKGTAFASNGHFIMKIRTNEEMIDHSVNHFFFVYRENEEEECILENANPFQSFGISTDDLFGVFNVWMPYNIKLRIDDLLDAANDVVPTVRNRRKYTLHVSYGGYATLRLRFDPKGGEPVEVLIPSYGRAFSEFPPFSVNLSYLTKILKVVADWYYVVDICVSNDPNSLVMIKAKNPHDVKPNIRFMLGQYK